MSKNKYTMIKNVGVYDEVTNTNYTQLNITDKVAKRLLKSKPNYKDRILTVEEYEELGSPSYFKYHYYLIEQELIEQGVIEVEEKIEEDIPTLVDDEIDEVVMDELAEVKEEDNEVEDDTMEG